MKPILPDSSWYIRQTRVNREPFHALALLAESRDIATCGVVVAEVGRGIRKPNILENHLNVWREMLWVESSYDVWEHTMELAWQLDREGTPLAIPDIHIASCALSIGAVILTHDQHFKRIPGVVATDRIY